MRAGSIANALLDRPGSLVAGLGYDLVLHRLVFVVSDEGTVSAKPVTLGPIIDALRVIRSGVAPTDWVIVNGVQRARKGIKVKAEKTVIEQNPKAASLP